MTSQLITIRCTIDRVGRAGSADAVSLACGAFRACRDHVCGIAHGACVREGAGRRTFRVFQGAKIVFINVFNVDL